MKGVSTALMAIVVLVAAMGVGIFAYYGGFQAGRITKPPAPIEYKGEFDEFFDPEEVSGTDLSITDWDVNETGVVPDGNVVMAYDLNGTDGQTAYLAYGFEVDGNLEGLDVEGALVSPTTTSEIELRKAYILKDEEGVNLDVGDATYTFTIEDDEEFDKDLGAVSKGKYVMVVEAKGITTSGIASGDDLLTIEMDATTDGDNDYLEATIDNA